jgi:hypothetical protein
MKKDSQLKIKDFAHNIDPVQRYDPRLNANGIKKGKRGKKKH